MPFAHQLTKLNIHDSNFSMPMLYNLLQYTANLSQIRVDQYSAPLQCYDDLGKVSLWRWNHHCCELMNTLRDIRQTKRIFSARDICHNVVDAVCMTWGPDLVLTGSK